MKNHKFLVYFTHPYLTLPVSNLQKKKKHTILPTFPPLKSSTPLQLSTSKSTQVHCLTKALPLVLSSWKR